MNVFVKYTFGILCVAAWCYVMIKLVIAYPDMTLKEKQDFNNLIILMGD